MILTNQRNIWKLINWILIEFFQNIWLIHWRFFEIWRRIEKSFRNLHIWEFRIWRMWLKKHWSFWIHKFVWFYFKLIWQWRIRLCRHKDFFSYNCVMQCDNDRRFFIMSCKNRKIFYFKQTKLIDAKWFRWKFRYIFKKNFILAFQKFLVFIWRNLLIRRFWQWNEKCWMLKKRDFDV